MRTGNYISKSTLQEAKELLIKYLSYRFQTDRGNTVNLYPLKIIKYFHRRDLMNACILSYINYFLKKLAEYGIAESEARTKSGRRRLVIILHKDNIPKAIEVIKKL